MVFQEDVNSLIPTTNVKIPFSGTAIPVNKDYCFKAKRRELVDQYSGARLFLSQTDTSDWNYWFNTDVNSEYCDVFKNIYKAYFYETALMYYNIIVDLSWTICYVCAEYAIYKGEKKINYSGMLPIEEAASTLRDAEKLISNPAAENNPLAYLQKMAPEYKVAIDLVQQFWNNFGDSPIRTKYNYCKHRGKPAYSEIEVCRGGRVMDIYIANPNTQEKVQITSDVNDVRWHISLKDSIAELKEFDENTLFPYIRNLLQELESALDPSPLAF